MAAKKTAKKKTRKIHRRMRSRPREQYRRAMATEVGRKWITWNHDLDTLLHELVKNPALASVDPVEIVARAEKFADALRALQDRRRPAGVDYPG